MEGNNSPKAQSWDQAPQASGHTQGPRLQRSHPAPHYRGHDQGCPYHETPQAWGPGCAQPPPGIPKGNSRAAPLPPNPTGRVGTRGSSSPSPAGPRVTVTGPAGVRERP